MHFGENQLSRSLIGLSPLTTGHPPGFQPWWVRASTTSYSRFTLPMARSPRFGSRTRYSHALFGLAFATAPPHGLTSQHAANSQAHSSKGTQSRQTTHKVPPATLPRLVGTRFQVLFHSAPAVLFTIPSRYSPLSVTREYLGLTGGPARFTQDSSSPMLLGCLSNKPLTFQLRGSYPLRRAFHMPFAYINGFSLALPPADNKKRDPTTPHAQPLPGLTHIRFSLLRFRSPLLPESLLFSLPTGTEMFHFPAFPPHTLYIQMRVTAHDDCRVPPFGHPRITARLTTPRGLSRPPTSFIGSWYQGIHRAPLKTWPQMLASTVQFSNNNQPPTTPHSTTPCEYTGTGNEDKDHNGRALRHPTARPTPSLHPPAFHTKAVLTGDIKKIPNSQRSTHEQPAPDTRR
jgi:hypothetical protein